MSDPNDLEAIDPRSAMELFLEESRGELSPNTVQAREYRLDFFVRWCEGEDNDGESRIENLNEISGRDFLRYRNWRKDGINKVTLRTHLSDLRQLMKFCVRIDAVPESIPEKIDMPVFKNGENVRESFLSHDEATAIIEWLERYHYASLDHALFALAWETGARISGLHSLDVDDIDWDDERIEVCYRPDEGTRLKNSSDGERIIALSSDTMQILRDYTDINRTDMTDDYGRRPLFASRAGRMHKRHLSKHMYYITVPCLRGEACPSGKDPATCEHSTGYGASVECPHNTRPHDVRRGSITHWLKQEVPEKVISDRMNVSTQTLDRHYDKRTKEEKAELRSQYLDDV